MTSPTTTPNKLDTAPGIAEKLGRADARRNHQRVLAAARAVFAEQGVDAQMDEIARKAGVGVGTVYRHFPDKRALLEALVVERFRQFAEAGRRVLEHGEVTWEAFSRWLHECGAVQANDRAYCGMLTEELPAGVDGDVAADVGLDQITAEIVERGKRAGVLREDLQFTDVPLVMCGVGVTALRGHGPAGGSWERHLALVLDGMRAPAASKLPE
jgi:AcrR family transcriptional regulator